ncbi:hypothetical protein NDU88_009136 [Pleurodeles waltl]|uniref:Uncharacterized protein n=1 Tax=Pleurodeles waltl TaxID=8319 RepID=A0AAV7NZU2_PLEWA|nr:hypothetical protein NDU88_009136 [Pleurodeles waltl]
MARSCLSWSGADGPGAGAEMCAVGFRAPQPVWPSHAGLACTSCSLERAMAADLTFTSGCSLGSRHGWAQKATCRPSQARRSLGAHKSVWHRRTRPVIYGGARCMSGVIYLCVSWG